MNTIHVLSPWTGSGSEEDPNRPLLRDVYQLVKWSDVTGTPADKLLPNPNLVMLKAVVTDEVLAQIQADIRFYVLSID